MPTKLQHTVKNKPIEFVYSWDSSKAGTVAGDRLIGCYAAKVKYYCKEWWILIDRNIWKLKEETVFDWREDKNRVYKFKERWLFGKTVKIECE